MPLQFITCLFLLLVFLLLFFLLVFLLFDLKSVWIKKYKQLLLLRVCMPCVMSNRLRDFVSTSSYVKVLQYSYACMLLCPACCLTAIFISVVTSGMISLIWWNLWSKTTMMRLRGYSSFFWGTLPSYLRVNESTNPLFKTTFFRNSLRISV